ncbi:MAG: hypothetical protein JSV09_15765 [Thermoplasmata archaeon]|nr:MAG: hypothetical protein JSV09_15765 [Thermoplasmata archaeon]
MLFHVTITHSVDNCPGFNPELAPKSMEVGEKIPEMAKELNIKIHFFVSGLPEHVEYALLEAAGPAELAMFLSQYPYKVDFKATAVEHMAAVIEKMKPLLQKQ